MKGRRIKKIWSKLKSKNIEALFINSPEDIRYITGFTGSEALLLLTKTKSYLFVDSRYTGQADDECREATIIESKERINEVLKHAHKLGIKEFGFDPQQLVVAQYRELRKTGTVNLIPISDGLERMRSIKDSGEIKLLKKSANISSRSFLEVIKCIKVGVEEREVALLLEFQIRKNGAEGIPFPFIVASGQRGTLPHGVASGKRIRRGEFITIDYGAVYRGYCSDETCTVIIGKPTQRQKRVYQTVKDAHDRAINMVRPGIKIHQVDSAARRLIEKAGLGKYFRHGTGHGVGLSVHEEPRIAPKQEDIIEVGMVFTIEPGVYIPGWGGVRIEDMVRVTGQGCEPMSSVPKELYCV